MLCQDSPSVLADMLNAHFMSTISWFVTDLNTSILLKDISNDVLTNCPSGLTPMASNFLLPKQSACTSVVYTEYTMILHWPKWFTHSCCRRHKILRDNIWSETFIFTTHKTPEAEVYKSTQPTAYYRAHNIGSRPGDTPASLQISNQIKTGLWLRCVWFRT